MSDSHDALVELFESIGHFLKRLDIYTKIPPTPALDEVVIKILVELLSTLALATKELKQGRPSESVLADVFRYSVRRREIRKKTFWRQGHRGGTTRARSINAGRGPDYDSRDSSSGLLSCSGYE